MVVGNEPDAAFLQILGGERQMIDQTVVVGGRRHGAQQGKTENGQRQEPEAAPRRRVLPAGKHSPPPGPKIRARQNRRADG
jgi:hypothetical protein